MAAMRNANVNVRRTGAALVAATVVAAGLVGCQKKGDLSSDKGKSSYAIGMQIGNSLRQQNAEIDPDSLATGIRDGLANQQPRVKPEELQAAMNTMNQAAQQRASQEAEKNLKEGEAWLEQNKSKPNVKVTPSGLQYEVLKEGTGAIPKETDMVKVHYTGTLVNGTKFDSSIDRGQPVDIPVNGVIPGWTEALKMMKTGSRYKLYIPAKLAYGPQTRPNIPSNSVLLFEVELLETKAGNSPPPPPSAAAKTKTKK